MLRVSKDQLSSPEVLVVQKLEPVLRDLQSYKNKIPEQEFLKAEAYRLGPLLRDIELHKDLISYHERQKLAILFKEFANDNNTLRTFAINFQKLGKAAIPDFEEAIAFRAPKEPDVKIDDSQKKVVPNPQRPHDPPIMDDAIKIEILALAKQAQRLAVRSNQSVSAILKAVEKEVNSTGPKLRPQWPRDALPEERDNPAAFAWRAYAAEAQAGTLHRGIISQDDKRNKTKLAYKLEIWLRRKKNQARIPEGFDIPTLPEWNTRQLAKVDPAKLKPARRTIKTESTPESRLYEVARARAAHSTPSYP